MKIVSKLLFVESVRGLRGDVAGPAPVRCRQSEARLGGIPRGGFKYENKYLGFPWCPHGDFKP